MTSSMPGRYLVSAVVLVLSLVGASGVSAQSSLDAADAAAFIGDWGVTLTTPDGDVPFTIHISDVDGKVAAQIGDGAEGQTIDDLKMDGEELVASYSMDYQGMDLPVVINFARDGDDLRSDWDFAGGMYSVSAVATRQ